MIGLSGAWRTALVAAAVLGLTGCGASIDSGVHPTSPSPTPAATAKASPVACTSPSDVPTYQLPGATAMAGNLEVKNLVVGTGKEAEVGDTISVSYVGKLTNGSVFDSSAKDNNNKPISFKLSTTSLIAGWVEGIPGMRVGGERELVIPASLGYQCSSPSSAIPADSTLIFTINLVGVS